MRSSAAITVMDAYCHLDMEHPSPIADIGDRMQAAGVSSALLVETWNGANRALLEQTICRGAADRFRIALCYREGGSGPLCRLLSGGELAAVRMATAHISGGNEVCREVDRTGKLLIAHAEAGIGNLRNGLGLLYRQFPEIRVYVPHLGWPVVDGKTDPDWEAAIREFATIPAVILGVSAIAHFSSRPFPHEDVRELALAAISQMPASRIAIGSDYPLFEKDRYADYISLARRWVTSIHPDWSFSF